MASKPKKKILFIIPSLVGGGAEMALITLLQHLDTEKYEIDLCVAEKKGRYLDQVPDSINILFLFANQITRKIVIELHRRFNVSWPFKWLTRHIIRSEYNMGICFLDSVFSDMLLFLNDRISQNSIVLHSSYESNNNWNKYIKGGYKARLQRRYQQIDTIVGVSRDALDEFISMLGEYNNSRVIHNPINRDKIVEKATAFNTNFSNGLVNITAVGNLLPVKGYSNLLKACKLLKDSGRDFKLRILGKGPLEGELKEQIQEMGLTGYVSLLGFRDNPYPYMLHSDLFVMSSFSEALPTVLCEAMILGKPVVVTNCSGCKGLVDEGVYGLMKEQTPQAIFEGLKLMIDDPDLRKKYSLKSKERSKLFDIDKAINEYEKLLDQSC
jgi:glycosyltransferase involved in cell wall biosynthesis